MRCFVAVFEKRSVSAAAEVVHMTQPPLSMLIKKLEEELGVTLFTRKANRLHPTPTAELFYLRARELLSSMSTIARELKESEAGTRGTIRIGCSTAASLFLIPDVMKLFTEQGLKITMHVQEGETAYLIQRLREGNLDLAICRSQIQSADIDSVSLMDEPLYVALPLGHKLERKKHVQLSDLREENFILHSSPLGSGISDSLMTACEKAGFMPQVVYRGVETMPMLLLAAKGIGVAFAPASFAKLPLTNLPKLVPLKNPEIRTSLNLITKKNSELQNTTVLFVEALLKNMRSYKSYI